jgi:hypothetical protein
VPRLLKDLIVLLKVYYDYQVFGDRQDPDTFPDNVYIIDPILTSQYLLATSIIITTHPSLLSALMEDEYFAKLILNDPPGYKKKFHGDSERHNLIWGYYHNAHQLTDEGGRPSMEERIKVYSRLLKLRAYRVYHHFLWFLAPIWLKLANETFESDTGSTYAPKAMELMIIYTCNVEENSSCGDSALISILFYYHYHRTAGNPEMAVSFLHRWIQNGGMTALLLGAVSNHYDLSLREL